MEAVRERAVLEGVAGRAEEAGEARARAAGEGWGRAGVAREEGYWEVWVEETGLEAQVEG